MEQIRINHIMDVNGVQVEKGSCVVGFVLESEVFGKKEVTHNELYKVLEGASNLVKPVNYDSKCFLIFTLGNMKMWAYTK